MCAFDTTYALLYRRLPGCVAKSGCLLALGHSRFYALFDQGSIMPLLYFQTPRLDGVEERLWTMPYRKIDP